MSSSASGDDRIFPNVFPRDIGDNKDKIMDSDNKKVEGVRRCSYLVLTGLGSQGNCVMASTPVQKF